MALRVSSNDFKEKVLESKLPVLVEFYSDSCIPCKQLSPVIGAIEDDYEDKVNVYKVNVNYDSELASEYMVMVSPTIVFFKDGKQEGYIRGLTKRENIEEELKKLL